MARFTVVVKPDGQAVLTTEETFSAERLEWLRQTIDRWSVGEVPVLVLTDAKVIQVSEVEIDLSGPPAEVDA